jgi:hypothetical protein
MNRTELAVFNKYLEIKQDLLENLNEVFNKQHTYTHKYRGNITTDVNVALEYGPRNERIIKIFVRADGKWIKDVLSIFGGRIDDSTIKTNIAYNE